MNTFRKIATLLVIGLVVVVSLTAKLTAETKEWGVSKSFISMGFEIDKKCGNYYTSSPDKYEVCRQRIEKKYNFGGKK
jgi:hypothetical protein